MSINPPRKPASFGFVRLKKLPAKKQIKERMKVIEPIIETACSIERTETAFVTAGRVMPAARASMLVAKARKMRFLILTGGR